MPLLSNLSEMYWCVYVTSMSISLSVFDISSLANNQFVWLIQGETQQVKTQLGWFFCFWFFAFLTCSYYIPKHPEYTFRWLIFETYRLQIFSKLCANTNNVRTSKYGIRH